MRWVQGRLVLCWAGYSRRQLILWYLVLLRAVIVILWGLLPIDSFASIIWHCRWRIVIHVPSPRFVGHFCKSE